ncbi:MAG: VIT1/CCC1 transporter family protein [Candidatus Micrarchaeota archaeon]|nr:VIT1/CCC1 transporter family protein [Candidatus Micrarchaeota archaeon]
MKRKKTKAEIAEFSKRVQQHMEEENKNKTAAGLADIILGGQDGLVNVLGIVLGVASATSDRFIVLVAGLVATFAESVSMAAVAYSSSRAEQDHYRRELEQEKWEIEHLPEVEEEEIRLIYMRKGLRGKELERMVKSVTSNKEVWLSIMMSEELGLPPIEKQNPIRDAAVVGISAIIGSIIPLIPFLFFSVGESILLSIALSTLALFLVGAYKAKITVGKWWKSGLEMALVGMLAAAVGYFIGALLGEWFGLRQIPS